MTPSFFSVSFHTRYFPALLLRRLGIGRDRDVTVREHVRFELPIAFAACGVLTAFALPAALAGSVLGGIGAAAGIAGLVALLVHSVSSVWGVAPTYEGLRPAVFFFFLALGVVGGLFAGRLAGWALLALVGPPLGYVTGIFAGLWAQRLGWLAGLFDLAAVGGVFGLVLLAAIVI